MKHTDAFVDIISDHLIHVSVADRATFDAINLPVRHIPGSLVLTKEMSDSEFRRIVFNWWSVSKPEEEFENQRELSRKLTQAGGA